MSKNDKQQQSNPDAAASRSGCVQKVLDTQPRFIDDFMTLRVVIRIPRWLRQIKGSQRSKGKEQGPKPEAQRPKTKSKTMPAAIANSFCSINGSATGRKVVRHIASSPSFLVLSPEYSGTGTEVWYLTSDTLSPSRRALGCDVLSISVLGGDHA
jgi:hypothetical protein